MLEQVHSNQERMDSLRDKFNNTTIFLTKFIFQSNFDILKKSGYVDAFISDPEIMDILKLGERQRFLFLLYKNKKMKVDEIKKITSSLAIVPVETVFSYELVNDYCMVVFEFPEKYVEDFDHFTNGNYSKFSQSFKDHFPVTRPALNSEGKVYGREYTLYHHIFNKTEWLKQFWLERLNLVELDPKVELWQKPSEKDLIFNVKNII